jgi:hypothetical protein
MVSYSLDFSSTPEGRAWRSRVVEHMHRATQQHGRFLAVRVQHPAVPCESSWIAHDSWWRDCLVSCEERQGGQVLYKARSKQRWHLSLYDHAEGIAVPWDRRLKIRPECAMALLPAFHIVADIVRGTLTLSLSPTPPHTLLVIYIEWDGTGGGAAAHVQTRGVG